MIERAEKFTYDDEIVCTCACSNFCLALNYEMFKTVLLRRSTFKKRLVVLSSLCLFLGAYFLIDAFVSRNLSFKRNNLINACILVLLKEKDLEQFSQTLIQLAKHCIWKYNYPYGKFLFLLAQNNAFSVV